MDLLDGIDVTCPACGHRSRYPLVHAGKSVACPSCKREHLIPAKDASGSARLALPPAPAAPPVAPPAPAVAKPATAKPATQPLADAEKILFVCGSCHYRARIPAQYAGMAVRCPSCDTAQIATADSSGGTTGNTVQLSKIPTAGHKTTIRPGNVLFICSLCNFEAQLAKHYVGKAIRCPGCHAPQVVAGEPPPKDPVALERHTTASAESAPTGDPRFICVGCGYRARIPSQYMGLAVTCPKCDTVQIATPEDQEGPATGDTVAISRMKTADDGAKLANPQVSSAASDPAIKAPAAKAAASPAPSVTKPAAPTTAAGGGDKVRFTCSACGFKARIPSSYAGENIHCPGCNAVQFVLRSGQLSPNATGNTQIIQLVQTAAATASPDAIATPTHTPAQGLPVISDEPPVARPAAPIAKPAGAGSGARPPSPPAPPAAKPMIKFTTPPPAVPVAQPAGTAAAEATIDDLLRFDEPPAEEAPKAAGKVVRRGSDRLPVVGNTKTPLPVAANTRTPLPVEPTPPAKSNLAAAMASLDDDPPSDPLPAKAAAKPASKPAAKAVPPPKPAVKTDRTSKPAPRPEVQVAMPEAAPAKQSNALVLVIAVFGLGLLGGLGFLGWQVMESNQKIGEMGTQLNQVQSQLKDANAQLKDTNAKLSKAEEDAKLAKEAADLAAKKQAEEATARKASEAKAVELEAKLKAAEEAAAKAAADAKAASEKPATPAVETPK